MITSEQIQEYLAGRLAADARERFEDELASDPEALRQLVEHEKLEAALHMLLGRPGRARVMASITAVIRSETASAVKADVLREVRAGSRQGRSRVVRLTAWLTARSTAVWSAGLAAAAVVVFGLIRWSEPASGRGEGVAE